MSKGWDKVEFALDMLYEHRVFRPRIEAQRRVLALLKQDPSLFDVERGVSHASLRLGYPDVRSFILVEWDEERGFQVVLLRPDWQMQTRAVESEDGVLSVIHEYLRALREFEEAE